MIREQVFQLMPLVARFTGVSLLIAISLYIIFPFGAGHSFMLITFICQGVNNSPSLRSPTASSAMFTLADIDPKRMKTESLISLSFSDSGRVRVVLKTTDVDENDQRFKNMSGLSYRNNSRSQW